LAARSGSKCSFQTSLPAPSQPWVMESPKKSRSTGPRVVRRTNDSGRWNQPPSRRGAGVAAGFFRGGGGWPAGRGAPAGGGLPGRGGGHREVGDHGQDTQAGEQDSPARHGVSSRVSFGRSRRRGRPNGYGPRGHHGP